MRIALLTYSTRPRGGVVHTLALAEALARRGCDVTVWAVGRGDDAAFYRTVDPAVTVRIVSIGEVAGESVGERVVRSVNALRAALPPDAYDVVHAQDCISANAVDDCVRTVHHIDHFTTPQLVDCHDRAIRRPRARICVSKAVAAQLSSGWGLEATVIESGVDAQRFADAADDLAAVRRWRAGLGRFVLSVGGIEPRKGSLDLVRAMALVRSVRPEVSLVVAGGETLFDYRGYRADFDSLAASLGVEPVILGPVDQDVLPSLVAAADVFAFPSLNEGFGLAAMEALAAGVPLVVRDLPVFREVFADAASFAADVPALASALGSQLDAPLDLDRAAAGRRLALSHSWDAAAAAHLDFYAGLTPVPVPALAGPSTART